MARQHEGPRRQGEWLPGDTRHIPTQCKKCKAWPCRFCIKHVYIVRTCYWCDKKHTLMTEGGLAYGGDPWRPDTGWVKTICEECVGKH